VTALSIEAPKRLVSRTARKSSALMRMIRSSRVMPALLTRMSTFRTPPALPPPRRLCPVTSACTATPGQPRSPLCRLGGGRIAQVEVMSAPCCASPSMCADAARAAGDDGRFADRSIMRRSKRARRPRPSARVVLPWLGNPGDLRARRSSLRQRPAGRTCHLRYAETPRSQVLAVPRVAAPVVLSKQSQLALPCAPLRVKTFCVAGRHRVGLGHECLDAVVVSIPDGIVADVRGTEGVARDRMPL
jgi:hypothetical protein